MPNIAIVGASSDRSKFGNKAVRAYAQSGYHVYPVNPRESTIEGWPVYRTVLDVPAEKLDRVSIYLPPAIAERALDDIAKKRSDEVWLNPGADAPHVIDKARGLGLNVIAGCSIVAIGASPAEFPES